MRGPAKEKSGPLTLPSPPNPRDGPVGRISEFNARCVTQALIDCAANVDSVADELEKAQEKE